MILSDLQIIERVDTQGMIAPFEAKSVRKGVVSYGLSSMGYDFRLHDVFWKPWVGTMIGVASPLQIDDGFYEEKVVPFFDLMPGSYVLGRSFEYFQMPDDVLGIVYGKSTYARLGVMLNMTPIEPGWKGYMTLCIANLGRSAVCLHAYQGIGQIVFHLAKEVPLTTYATKQGKYQDAQGIVTAKVE